MGFGRDLIGTGALLHFAPSIPHCHNHLASGRVNLAAYSQRMHPLDFQELNCCNVQMMNSPIKLSDEAHSQLTSLNAEAATGRGMWIAFNSLMAYLAVSVIGVTHEDLLLDNALTLPIIGANMPLSWLAILGPALLLVIYFSVLLEHSLIARKAIALNELLSGIGGERSSQNIRLNATTYFFAQNMVAPKQNWLLRRGMSLIGWLTLDFFPLAVLVLFQLTFLPLQSNAVTWTQRFAVFLACVMVFTFGLVCRQPHLNFLAALRLLFAKSKFALTLLGALTIGTLMFSLFIATGAQERKNWNDYSSIVQGTWLFDRAHDGVSERQASWFSQTLIVPRVDIREENNKKLLKSLRGRSLIGADFANSFLRGVDFTASDLTGADFAGSDLVRSKFECANRIYVKKKGENQPELNFVDKGKVVCTSLRGANLSDTKLAFAKIVGAEIEGASIRNVDLRLTNLNVESVVGLDLREAKLGETCCSIWTAADLRGAHIYSQTGHSIGENFPDSAITPTLLGGSLADLRHSSFKGLQLSENHISIAESSVPSDWPDMRDANILADEMPFEGLDELKSIATAFELEQIQSLARDRDLAISASVRKFFNDGVAASEKVLADNDFLQRRTEALVAALKEHPLALDSFVSRYNPPKVSERKLSLGFGSLFFGTAHAWGSGGYGGCGCSAPFQGEPNFDTKLFAHSLQKLPVFDAIEIEIRQTLNEWAAGSVVQTR